MAAWPHLRHRALCDLGGLWSKVAPVRPTLRCTRLATAGFARFRERVNSNVSPQLEIQSRAMPHGARTTEHCQDRARALSHELSTEQRGGFLVRARRTARLAVALEPSPLAES